MKRGIVECPVALNRSEKKWEKPLHDLIRGQQSVFTACCTCCYVASCHLFLFSSQHNLNGGSQASPQRVSAPYHSWAIYYSTIPWSKRNCKYSILHFHCTAHNSTKCLNCHHATPDKRLSTHFPVNWHNDERVKIDRKSWKSDYLRFIHNHAFVLSHM